MQYTTTLIELDSILDTRFSMLSQMFPDKIDEIMGSYFGRPTNELPGIISYEDFNHAYLNRNRSVLKNAVMTKTVLLLKDFVSTALENMIHSSLEMPPKLIINTYPYELTKEEVKNITVALLFHIGNKVDIEIASLTHKEISPLYLEREVWSYIKFDYYNWLDDIAEYLDNKNQRCPDTKLITPAYLHVKTKDLPSLFNQQGKRIDPFHHFKIGLSYIIDLEFISTTFFNRLWVIPENDLTTNDD